MIIYNRKADTSVFGLFSCHCNCICTAFINFKIKLLGTDEFLAYIERFFIAFLNCK